MKYSLIFIAFILTAVEAFSCSCAGIPSINEAVQRADVVSVVEILDREDITFVDTSKSANDTAIHGSRRIFSRYNARIISILKGLATIETLTIYTPTSEASCGIQFSIGERYILYGDRDPFLRDKNYVLPTAKDIFWTHLCTRTTIYTKREYEGIINRNKLRLPSQNDRDN